ncbi:MAG: hypothetical protein HOP19_05310, partial [Acidobacteria bacterium]|nr:hypothetical protein [Acidobacteriota bacterium]
NAADAAALAGATTLNSKVTDPDTAVARAIGVANSYQFNVAHVIVAANQVRFAKNMSQFDDGTDWNVTTAKAAGNFDKVRFVKVTIAPTTVKVYLAGMVLGRNMSSFTRAAVAGQSASGATATGTDADPGITTLSNPSRIVLLEDDSGGGTLSTVGTCANNTKYTQGCTYTVNMTPPCDALSATYEVASGYTGSAGNDLNKQMVTGLDGCFCKNSTLPVNTHPQAINIKNGLDTLFNVYSNTGIPATSAGEFPPDTNVRQSTSNDPANSNYYNYSMYKAGTGATAPTRPGVAGRRVITLGIMKKTSWWIDENDPNYETATMKTYKFGRFFLKKRPTSSGQLQLEYLSKSNTDRLMAKSGSSCTTCTSTPGTAAESGEFAAGYAVPVLYR